MALATLIELSKSGDDAQQPRLTRTNLEASLKRMAQRMVANGQLRAVNGHVLTVPEREWPGRRLSTYDLAVLALQHEIYKRAVEQTAALFDGVAEEDRGEMRHCVGKAYALLTGELTGHEDPDDQRRLEEALKEGWQPERSRYF